MMNKGAPEVNAGSMADIAFLLLIFFLVTTVIESDAGLNRLLPRINPDQIIVDRKKKNVLPIFIDAKGQLLVQERPIEINELKAIAIDFIDNGGAPAGDPAYCNYCKGNGNPKSSDNPNNAIISVNNNRETSYGAYITVQNELVSAYTELRNRESQKLYGQDFTTIESAFLNPETEKEQKEILKEKVLVIQGKYPLNISDATLK